MRYARLSMPTGPENRLLCQVWSDLGPTYGSFAEQQLRDNEVRERVVLLDEIGEECGNYEECRVNGTVDGEAMPIYVEGAAAHYYNLVPGCVYCREQRYIKRANATEEALNA